MKKRLKMNVPRRLLSLVLSAAMVLTLLPVPAFAAESDGLCEHHSCHTAECGYVAAVEGQPCTHEHTEACYTTQTACRHTHTPECYSDGTLPAEGEAKAADACTHVCTEESGCITRVLNCQHIHDESCGYIEAVAGQPCGFVCEVCAGEESEPTEPQPSEPQPSEPQPSEPQPSEPEPTETQPEEKVITAWEWVDQREIIDPETGNALLPFAGAENVARFDDIVELLPVSILADGEPLTLGQWTCEAYPEEGAYEGEFVFETTLPEGYVLQDGGSTLTLTVVLGDPEGEASEPTEPQPEQKVIADWEWIDDWEIIDPDSGNVLLPFASAENVAYFDDIVELLPVAIAAGGEELPLGDWVCEAYPEEGAYEGEFVFETTLPEGYVLPDETNVLSLTVVLGDPEGEPVAMMGITPVKPTEDYWEDNYHFYKLYTKEHLYWFANEVNTGNENSIYLSAVLMNDITVNTGVLDANGNLNSGSFEVWTPIGSSNNKYYCGKFDGQGHTISGLYVNDSTEDFIGLFGAVNSCNITRLGVVDSYFGGDSNVGGLCGYVTNNAIIRYCYTTATVTGNSHVGTFCGYAGDGASIYYCYSAGRVGSDYGAFCGATAYMGHCYALSNTNYIGTNDKVNYKTMAAFRSGEVTYGMTETDATPGWRQTIGTHDFPQCTTEGDIVYRATVDGTVIYHNHTGDTCPMCDVPTFENGHYTILTKEQLYWFADYVRYGHPDASAWVDKDITVDDDWIPIGSDGSYTGEFQGTRKYITISGIPEGSSLLGPINQDVTIRNFKIADGGSLCTDNFGCIESCFAIGGAMVRGTNQGTIKDSGVYSGKLIADDNNGSIVACTASNNSVLVAGDNSGNLTNCTASDASKLIGGNNSGDITDCEVTSSQSSYASESMLIAGDNSGNLTNCTVSTGDTLVAGNNNGGTITNCEVTFGNKLIGGNNSGTITGCSVSRSTDVKLVAGANSGTIEKSYASGVGATLCDSNSSGGKIINCYANASSGSAKLCGSNSGTIANCYAAGGSGTTLASGGSITNCYYLAGTSASTVGGTTLTTDAPFASGEVAYLLNQGTDTYPGGVWGQSIGASNDPCPVLYGNTVYYHVNADPQYHNHNGYCSICTPTPDYVNNVWQIKNVDDLYWFAQYVIGNINPGDTYTYDAILVNDITVNQNVLNPDGTLSADTDRFMVWTPIGDASSGFTGTFNGNNKTISGLYVNASDKSNIGLFGVLNSGATVKDLTIRDSYFGGSANVGSICGNSSGNVENCTNSGTVSGRSYVGGVLGYSTGSAQVSKCGNTGNVSGTGYYVGGVFGHCSGGSVSNCYNTGSITSTSYFVGGVGGYNAGEVTACYNTGMVSSNDNQVGGVIGKNDKNGNVTACYNTGVVSGSNCVGGVCGYVSGGTVNACYSTGAVSGSSDVGGVCGTSSNDNNQTPKISNCYYNNELYSGKGVGSSYNSTIENVSGKTTAEFASGEVAYLLNGSSSTGTLTWKQNIDVGTPDATPQFTGGTVYATASSSPCPGYTNNSSGIKQHNYVNHVCTWCGHQDTIPVTVSGITAVDKTYDGNTVAELDCTKVTLTGVASGDTVTVTATGTFASKDVDENKSVNITNLTLTGANASKYRLADTGNQTTATASITAKDITVSITSNGGTYGGSIPAASTQFSGVVGSDDVGATLTYSGTANDGTVYNGTTVPTQAGTYTVTAAISNKNYNLTGTTDAQFVVNKATVTTPTLDSKAYTGTKQTADVPTSSLYTVTTNDGGIDVNDSGYPVTLALNDSHNYQWDDAGGQTTFRITQAANEWTVTPAITGWTYGEEASTPTYGARFGNNTVKVDYRSATGTAYSETAPTNAGSYKARFTVAATDNYAGLSEEKDFTISPKSVTVSGIRAEDKTYDGNTTATLNYDGVVFDGKLEADTLTVTATGTFADKNVNTDKTVTITGLSLGGASKDNYVLDTANSQARTAASITAREITITGTSVEGTRVYDGTTDAVITDSGALTNTVAGDDVTIDTANAAAAYDNKNVGENKTVTFSGFALAGSDKDNYTLKAQPASVTADITARPVTLTVTVKEKSFDGTTDAEIDTAIPGETDFVTDDDVQVVNGTAAFGKSSLGDGIPVSFTDFTLTGDDAGNYSITNPRPTDVTGKIKPSSRYLDLKEDSDFDGQTEVWVDGIAYPVETEDGQYVCLPESGELLTIQTYQTGTSALSHDNYPTAMKVYRIERMEDGAVLTPIPELDNLLQYSGCSIRVSGNRGIRMITSLTRENKAALTGAGLAGYTLEEYGTVVQWADTLGADSLTLNNGNHNYAYKKGVADPVFANVGSLTQYTNVLVGFDLEECSQDIIMRPYIILKDAEGQTVTLYGGVVSRSISYIAWQNQDTYKPGTAAYNYVHTLMGELDTPAEGGNEQ